MKKFILTLTSCLLLVSAYGQTSTHGQRPVEHERKTAGSSQTANDARSVVFILSGDFSGTIQGTTITGDSTPRPIVITIAAPAGDTLRAIPYTVSGGTLNIFTVK